MLWLNGKFVRAEEARIDPADRGLTLGDGLFETIRLCGGRALHLDRHMRRLRDGARFLFIPFQWDGSEIENALTGFAVKDGVARITLSRGPAARGLALSTPASPTMLISVSEAAVSQDTVRLVVCSITRRNELSPLSRLKSLNYLDSILARQEAVDRGADDALLLNTVGVVSEASAANLLVLLDEEWVTPKIIDGALPGIAREVLIEKLGVREATVTRDMVLAASAVALCNSLSLREAISVDGSVLPRNADQIGRLRRALEL